MRSSRSSSSSSSSEFEPASSSSTTSFDFGACPDQHIFARNVGDGRIVSKDAHRGEVVGQLDYLVPSGSSGDDERLWIGGNEEGGSAPYVREGEEKEIMCLEIGESAMLLLVPCYRKEGEIEAYRRVGVAIGYGNRKGFFYGCETRRVVLDGRREVGRDSLGRRLH